MSDNVFYGWYDDANQAVDSPTYDPPHDAPCLYCGRPILPDDVRTHSLMLMGPSYAKRSYFYRTHRSCDEEAGEGEPNTDSLVLAMIERNGD